MLVQHNAVPFFLAVAGGYNSPRQGYVGRGVRINAKRNGALVKGILTKDKITMSGNVTIDSYASCDPAKSTNGRYDPAKAQDNGGVACNGIISGDEITASGNIKIKGPLSTGPGGTAGVSGSISVGSKQWVDAGTTGIQSGWFRNDMNANIADAPAAPVGGFTSFPAGGTVNGVTYDWILNSGTYTINSAFSMSGQKKMLINGDVKIHFKGDLSMSGQSAINIAPTANLQIWGSGATISLSGQGLINNTGDPSRFTYYGTTSNTKVNLSGSTDFIGIIYAPYAEFTPSGGSQIHGAVVAKKFTGSGGFTLHYDECLGGSGSQARYIVTAWNEMTPEEVARVP
jgi:hypothetical protein